jgi:integrase/recombinase XerD
MATKKRTITRTQGYDYTPIGQAFEEFIMEKEFRNLSPATIKSYVDTFNLFRKFAEIELDDNPNEIGLDVFYHWMHSMKIDGIRISSINHYLRDLRAFFYWMMDADRRYIEKPFKVKMMEGQEETFKMFSDEEIDALLMKPSRNDSFVAWRNWAIVNWVLATGNRAATICEVQIGDVNFNHKEIILRHTKNKKAQVIPLSTSLSTVLKEYIKMWRAYKAEGVRTTKEDYLFCDISQSQMTTNALKHSFSKYCTSRDVAHTNIHGLRHNFAKMWIVNNGSMAKLQNILGHSSLEMTRKYVKLFGQDLKDDYDKFSPLDTIKRSAKRSQTVLKDFS